MTRLFPTILICGGALFAGAITAGRAAEEMKPPFALMWGEDAERIARKLAQAKAKVVERKIDAEGREAWHVEGIVQPGLKRTVFYFRATHLVEVELQYQKEDWGQPEYDTYMGQVRTSLDKRFGQGQLLARKTEPVGDVMQTVVGWKWNQNNAAIELFYFAAQNAGQVFRTLSVHYKTN